MTSPYNDSAHLSTPWDHSRALACMLWVHDNVRPEAVKGASAAAQKAVICHIARRADPDGGNAWPRHDDIADVTGLSRRGVQRALAALESAGLIAREGERQVGSGTPVIVWRITGKCVTVSDKCATMTPPKCDTVAPLAPVSASPCPTSASWCHGKGVTMTHDRTLTGPDRTTTPQPPRGGHWENGPDGLVERPPQLDTELPYLPDDGGDEPDRSTLPTAADRVAARTPAAVRLLDPPNLTGQGDALAVAAWYVACCPRPGGPPPLDVQGIQTLVAEVGADDVIEAVRHFYANGAPFPQPRALRQRVKTVRVERIQAERTAASARRAGTVSGVSLTHMMAGADPFKFGGGTV